MECNIFKCIRRDAIKQYTKQIFDITNCNDITIEEFEMSVKKLKEINKNDNNYKFNPNDYLTGEEFYIIVYVHNFIIN